MITAPHEASLTHRASRVRFKRLTVPCVAAVPAFIALAVLAGCVGQVASDTSSPVPSPSASTGMAPTEGVVWSDGSSAAASSPGRLGLDEASRSAALELAETAMGLFARPDVPYEVWWADLEPVLSARGTAAYVTVDPARIPVRQVSGPAGLPGWTTPEVARVSVPTDVGSYLVVVSRSDADPVWRVERFIAPEVLA